MEKKDLGEFNSLKKRKILIQILRNKGVPTEN